MRKFTKRTTAALLATGITVIATPIPAWGQAGSIKQEKESEQEDEKKSKSGHIVVTAMGLVGNGTSALPVQVLTGDELAHRRKGGLGETLAGLPGVHLDNFGGGASRPVIRGQTVPRIEILTDGANLFDASSVSPDHAITTDPLLLDTIEIQRGPAAVRYGGSAVNGAINLIDSKVPKALPVGGLTGATEVRYGTGDEEKAVAGRVTAGLGPFAIHAEGSRHHAKDYDVPDSYGNDRLKDSFAKSSSYAFGASWITDKGYIGAAYTRQNAEYGLPGHSHINGVCHTHGTDLHCATHGPFGDPFGSDDGHTAYIDMRSERFDLRADFQDLLPGIANIRLRGSYTDYQHDEVDGPALFSRYTNEVWDGRIELTHKPLFGFTGTLGLQYTDGKFSGLNLSDRHQLPLDVDPDNPPAGYQYTGFVPPFYHATENVGIFLSERRSFGAVDVEIAARKDWRTITQPVPEYVVIFPPAIAQRYEERLGPDWRQQYADLFIGFWADDHPDAKHNPFSVSLGATWNFDRGYSAALSLARTERAPNVRELFAHGNNLATNSYELGLSRTHYGSSSFPEPTTDVMETAKSVNLTFRKTGGPLEFEFGLFYQDIDDYIFARLIETEAQTGIPHNYLIYTASDARFYGIDGQISYRFNPQAQLTVFGDYVGTELESEEVDVTLGDTGDNLPRISPGRLGARFDWTSGPLTTDIEYYHTFEQDKIALYETPTDGYDMLNATIAYRMAIGGNDKNVEFYLRGTNLTNELAFAHTSFVKDQSPLRGRSVTFGMRHKF